MDDLVAERVLRAVELVPQGQVVSYGDLGGLVGLGPRHVGRVLATWGGSVPWWRVTNASGDLPAHLLGEARRRWAAEGIELKVGGRGCRIRVHRADLAALATVWDRAVADLDPVAGPAHEASPPSDAGPDDLALCWNAPR